MKKDVRIEDLNVFVQEFLEKIPNFNDKATIIGLEGNLGAGKTTFVKELAKQLNLEKEITSPTFNIMMSYDLKDSEFKKLIHIDLYRIEDESEIKILDLENLFQKANTLILIEWVDKINLENDFIKIKIDYKDEESRTFEIINE